MSHKYYYAIMACDPDGVMGKGGRLPWKNEEDLQHFADETLGHIIVMGSKTFEELPKEYLRLRRGIVFSPHKRVCEGGNPQFVASLDDFLALDCLAEEKKCFIIGGAQICTLFLEENLIGELTLTHFKKRYSGDVYFPLALIHAWPRVKMRETKEFIIYRYMNPHSRPL